MKKPRATYAEIQERLRLIKVIRADTPGITQRELAAFLGCSRWTVGFYERGAVKVTLPPEASSPMNRSHEA